MPLFAVTLDNLRTRKLTGAERGHFLANRYPLSDHGGAASMLDGLGKQIATERAKHGIPDPDTSAIRDLVRTMRVYEGWSTHGVTDVTYCDRPCRRREDEDDWSFAARAVR
jgi:hypothetical protein